MGRHQARRPRMAPLGWILSVLVLVSAACGATGGRQASPTTARSVSPATAPPAPSTPGAAGTFPHVMVLVLENREEGAVLGSPEAPYLNALAKRFGVAENAYGTTHPSLPNYLELVAGTTFGIDSDCTDCRVDGQTLVDQLDAKGIDWKAYMEAMPVACFRDASSGNYAKKHDPFMYVSHLADDPARCRQVVPYGQLSRDLTSGTAPPFLWVTPDLCDDGHDCSTATMDAWLGRNLEPVLRSSWFAAHGVVIVTFDEGSSDASCCTSARGGRIATVVAAQGASGGLRSSVPVDHAGMLATIEDLYGVARLGDAACPCAGSLSPLL